MDRLCDELGIDSISAGVTISMAMELFEKGILTETQELDLTWGNEDTIARLVRMMAYREGLGEMLSDGTRVFAKKVGNGAEKYAMHVKGLELPAYDPRGLKAHGLNFATAYNGADHNRGYAFQEVFGMPFPYPVERLAIKGKGILAKFNQDFCGTYDVATLCEFPTQLAMPHNAQEVVAMQLTGATGIEFTKEDVWALGERLNNLTRMFNVREGFSRKDDTLPERFMKEELKDGLSKGELITEADLNAMLDEYYEARGWDENGIPTEEKLRELGLV
ncbi:MAG: aldehyde ferredoxin oxidoreductase C-terminal domain-containing protein [Youngiibacter sp.]|nr:aldehyde ferredoxin oxidoreductase C-terminal domain-containing protein [Youngiibacter sp.]